MTLSIKNVDIRRSAFVSNDVSFESKSAGEAANLITVSGTNLDNVLTVVIASGELSETYEIAQVDPSNLTSGLPAPLGAGSELSELIKASSDIVNVTLFSSEYISDFSGDFSGGSGLPKSAIDTRTGEYHRLIHVNYDDTGEYFNTILEWKGLSRVDGFWKKRM